MNSALITAYDDADAELHKTRTIDDHDTVWSAVIAYMAENGVGSVKVQRYDSGDALVQQYSVTILPLV